MKGNGKVMAKKTRQKIKCECSVFLLLIHVLRVKRRLGVVSTMLTVISFVLTINTQMLISFVRDVSLWTILPRSGAALPHHAGRTDHTILIM